MRPNLIVQFLIAFATVIIFVMISLGAWINNRATVRILDSTAESAAHTFQFLLQSRIQGLSTNGSLSPSGMTSIHEVVDSLAQRHRFLSLKIWRPDGTIVYPTPDGSPHILVPDEVQAALRGDVIGKLSDLDGDTHAIERGFGVRMYEVYFPLRDEVTGDVVAVGEIYENADYIANAFFRATMDNVRAISAGGLAMFLLLVAIVWRGNRTIERQLEELHMRIEHQKMLDQLNGQLHARIAKGAQKAARIDELTQKRIGADLHDGTCQLLGFLVLTIDQLSSAVRSGSQADLEKAQALIKEIDTAARRALQEVRTVASGLLAPHLDGLKTLEETLAAIISEHKRHTRTDVTLILEQTCPDLPPDTVRVIGRVVQEALTNAVKHAEGIDQRVSVRLKDGDLIVVISDGGHHPVASLDAVDQGCDRLGLRGIRSRADALGGTLVMRPGLHGGTELEFSTPIVPPLQDRVEADTLGLDLGDPEATLRASNGFRIADTDRSGGFDPPKGQIERGDHHAFP